MRRVTICVVVTAVRIGAVATRHGLARPHGDRVREEDRIERVLLLSIDGMHALD
jgi:hypothetical protein